MPSEPVSTPVTALSRVIAQAAKTESSAAELFSAVTRWPSAFWVAIVNKLVSAASEYNWAAGSGKRAQAQRKPGPAGNGTFRSRYRGETPLCKGQPDILFASSH